ncbi:MAG: pilus assembly protein PilP [Burkholderiales bacterium]|nr:pilus assembly protein PilP [Burkholderiales bacterium]
MTHARIRLVRGLFVAAALALAGCGGERFGDLKQELAQMTKDLRGRVDPLPTVKAYEPAAYRGEALTDPFLPARIAVAQAAGAGGGGGLAPDMNRPREPLEAFPLDSLQMVGTVRLANEIYALVRAGTTLYRVKKGNYMGQNFGLITAIDEGEIRLKEVVQDSSGDWVERPATLQLQEAPAGARR